MADGTSAAAVARSGLLRRRKPDTVYLWLDRFQEQGIPGLFIRPGRGRKPAFSPHTFAPQEAKEAFLHLLRREPRLCGVARARWTLADLRARCDFLAPITLGGLSQLLSRLQISYQRARDDVRSPDPDYLAKLAWIAEPHEAARSSEGRFVLLYQDELTYYRQPTLARAYEARGDVQPRAHRSHRANTATRVTATLDPLTGKVVFDQNSRLGVDQLVRFYRKVREAYPEAERMAIVQDNWPVHFHPDVLVALEPQVSPWPVYRPGHWPKEPSGRAVKRWGGWHLPIQLVPLPTYASWTNPAEKLWRKGKQEVLHLHRLAEHLPILRKLFAGFLDQFADGSSELLRYVGLPIPA